MFIGSAGNIAGNILKQAGTDIMRSSMGRGALMGAGVGGIANAMIGGSFIGGALGGAVLGAGAGRYGGIGYTGMKMARGAGLGMSASMGVGGRAMGRMMKGDLGALSAHARGGYLRANQAFNSISSSLKGWK